MYKNNFICVIKHNGRILREIDGEVCLPFGSQYSILLKNKDSRRTLVDVEVDGENVLNDQKLIVDGNTSNEIKGFMRNMSVTNRFKFIHKTKEISDHRGDRIDDGLISVRYNFEIEKPQPVRIINKLKPYPEQWPYPNPWQDNYPNIKYTSYNCDVGDTSVMSCCKGVNEGVYDLSEEGITVKGSKITQEYQYGDIDGLEHKSYVIVLRLKGKINKSKKIVTKPLTVKTKLQCSTCGRRSKSTSKFCANCGTYLERGR